MLTARTISSISSPTFFSIVSCFMADSSGHLRGSGGFVRLGSLHGAPGVVGHQQHAAEDDCPAHQTHDDAWVAGHQGFDEGVGQRAVAIDRETWRASVCLYMQE